MHEHLRVTQFTIKISAFMAENLQTSFVYFYTKNLFFCYFYIYYFYYTIFIIFIFMYTIFMLFLIFCYFIKFD